MLFLLLTSPVSRQVKPACIINTNAAAVMIHIISNIISLIHVNKLVVFVLRVATDSRREKHPTSILGKSVIYLIVIHGSLFIECLVLHKPQSNYYCKFNFKHPWIQELLFFPKSSLYLSIFKPRRSKKVIDFSVLRELEINNRPILGRIFVCLQGVVTGA